MDIMRRESICEAGDGTPLFFRRCSTPARPVAILCIVHGHGDHSGMYEDAMAQVARSGYAVCAFDLRGHGRSGGPRGDSPTYRQLLDDVGLLLEEGVRCFGADLPCFLFGHSHGGGLVLNYALQRRPVLNGVIATSPWLRLAFRPPRWMVALARLLHVVAPDFGVAPRDERKALPDLVGRGRPKPRDEMVHRVITARLLFESRDAGDWALRHAAEFPLPLLVMHGVDDRATSPEASRQFVASVPGDATFLPLTGLRHLIHVEEIEEELFARAIAWMDARR
jgi:alpha-beta hydrolase superfamily lysophospholipase